MKQLLRTCGTKMGTTLALFLMLMSLTVGMAQAAPIADPDFTTPIVNPADLQKYVTPLPNAFLLQIAPDTAAYPGEDYYRVDMGQFNHDMQLLLNPAATGYTAAVGNKLPLTPSWGYSLVPPTATTPGTYYFPGPTIVNTQGRPTRVTWTNSLPPKHVLSLDPTLACGPQTTAGNVNGPLTPFANNSPNCAPVNRVVVHTHGAHVWDDSDGDPLAWFSNGFAVTGETWKPNTQHGPVGTYRYINDQEAGTIWYHDHAMGLTHLNVYAGLAGFFLITDANEANLRATRVLPQYKAATATTPAETYEIPIALQDRKFNPDATLAVPNNPVLDDTATIGANVPCDATVGAVAPFACLPAVPPATTPPNAILAATTPCDPGAVVNAYMCPAAKFSKSLDGSLIPYDPTITDPLRVGPFTAPSITPEFFGNVAIANGIVWPKQDTEQRKYRIRLLNGADSRTYFLKFDNPLVKTWHIGTDQAFLDKPVDRSADFIILMPGERIDLIVDFAAVPIGTRVLLQNYGSTATANGLPASPTNPLLDIPYDGVVPVIGQPLNPIIPDVLAFDVIAMNPAVPEATITLTTPLRPVPAFTPYPSLTATPTAPVRKLALIERGGSHGRFMLTLDGRDFMDPSSPVSELPKLGDTEIWEIANFTPDAHPMHLHLVAFQIMNRQEFSIDPASTTAIYDPTLGVPPFTRLPLMPYTAPPTYLFNQQIPGDLNYAPLAGGVATAPLPPDLWETGWKDTIQTLPGTVTRIIAKFDLPGLYVWHCHILSHEENDMMRPFIVTTPVKTVTAALSRNGLPLGNSEPAAQAAPITITAQGTTGLTGQAIMSPQLSNGFEYQFSITDPAGITTVVQPFIAWMYPMLDNFIWTPPKNLPGTYTIRVDARQASNTPAGASQAFTTLAYTLAGPSVAGVTSTSAAGAYKAAAAINVTVLFNQLITSTAGLTLTLNSGTTLSTGPIATPTASISIPYLVGATHNSPLGAFLEVTGISGTISDTANSTASVLTIPAGANLSSSVKIQVDTTVPTIASTTPAAAASFTNSANQVVSGTVSDPVGIQSFTVNGTAVTLAVNGAYSSNVALTANSANTITLVAIDMAGNQATATLTVTHDTTLPTVTLTAPTAVYVNSVNQTVTGTVTDPAGILSITVNGAAVTPNPAGTFSASITLTEGVANLITVVVTDTAGNVTTATKTVTHSAILPIVTFTSPSPFVNNVKQTLAGTATSPIGIRSVTVNGTAATLGTGGSFSIPLTLTANSANTIVVIAIDIAGNQETITLVITHDTSLPITTATPPPGTYSGSVSVSLSANKPGATIYYSTNGIAPTSASTSYVIGQPLLLSSPTTATMKLMYFAVDQAGNVEAVKTGSYTLHTADLSAKIAINSGKAYTNTPNVSLALSASDKLKVTAYAISVDGGATYAPLVAITPAVVTFSKKVAITLPTGDGLKDVFVKFTDGVGVVYAPVTTQIILDTVAPASTVTPVAGSYPGGAMKVALSASEKATIYYTTNGTTPTAAASIYKSPFTITGTNTTITVKYFAIDKIGNAEPVKTATYVFGHLADLVATVKINDGKKYTKSRDVSLSFTASDPASGGVASMSFSNDGINFTPGTPYAPATAMTWTLSPGNDLKTVYIRFVDKFAPPNIYTYTAQIYLAEGVQSSSGDIDGNGKCDMADALKALLASSGLTRLTTAEQARGDVGPLVNGVPQPDGKIDGGDALVIVRKVLGLVNF